MFDAPSIGALVQLACPHCNEPQMRARGQASYECFVCKKTFTREEGKATFVKIKDEEE